jgi:GMP synthase (glutamine-hydrolysing)
MTNVLLIIDFGTRHIDKIINAIKNIGTEFIIKIIQWNELDLNIFKECKIFGIILSGSPSHLYEPNCPIVTNEIFDQKIPILGICYGMQFIAQSNGGIVCKMNEGEFGLYEIDLVCESEIFKNVQNPITVFMQHYDQVINLPQNIKVLAHTSSCVAALEIVDAEKNIFVYGTQFHPEVETLTGTTIFKNFIQICTDVIKNDKISSIH